MMRMLRTVWLTEDSRWSPRPELHSASSALCRSKGDSPSSGGAIGGAAASARRSSALAIPGREGAGPQRSAFLSAFFALVGLHGLHVAVGLLWLATMMAQIATRGFRPEVERRLLCFNLFWHALDIIWVALFTMVYLMGVRG